MNRLLIAASAALILPVSLSAQPAPLTVTVTMTSYHFAPSPIVLQAGQPVRMVFENKAGKGHDFKAPEFFASSRILSGEASGGEVDLHGGGTAAITLVPARGTYPVHCSKFMHSAFGMKSEIVVQ
jgi:plastocyanin